MRGFGGSLRRVLVLGLLVGSAGDAAATPPEGFHLEPHVGFSHGRHRVDLPGELRYRWEDWKAFAPKWDAFHGIRARVALDYRWDERFRLFAQGQLSAVLGVGPNSSGAGAVYRAASKSGMEKDVWSLRPSQLFAEYRPAEGSWVRVGRQFVQGGATVSYAEPDWKYLKNKRLSQRLLGPVGWSDVARSYDGVSGRVALGDHTLHAVVAEPTTGVFDVENAFERQKDVIVGQLEWTLARGAWVENSELRAFFLGYSDTRDPLRVAGLFGDVELFTLGGSWLGVYPLGSGRVDVLLWGAFQTGRYADLGPATGVRKRDQLAGAAIGELGYQLPEVWSQPWLRLGVNYGSGDGNPDDDTRRTFFNVLPTNHLYYGYLDQLALQNLIDLLVQLHLAPLEKLGIELTYHRFWLASSADFRWAGTGAFSRSNLGYLRNPSNGSTDIGHELDVVASVPLRKGVVMSAGFGRLWGGGVFAAQPQRNATFGYVQLALSH